MQATEWKNIKDTPPCRKCKPGAESVTQSVAVLAYHKATIPSPPQGGKRFTQAYHMTLGIVHEETELTLADQRWSGVTALGGGWAAHGW